MGHEHEHSSKRRQPPTCVRDVSRLILDLKSSSRDGRIENYGLKSEVLYVSKLGCAKIIPTRGRKDFWERRMERSLPKQPAVILNGEGSLQRNCRGTVAAELLCARSRTVSSA
jgi:hypothetical protein